MLDSSSPKRRNTHIEISPQKYFIELNQNGSFPKSDTQVKIIHLNIIIKKITLFKNKKQMVVFDFYFCLRFT
jgi:hypothetical protein